MVDMQTNQSLNFSLQFANAKTSENLARATGVKVFQDDINRTNASTDFGQLVYGNSFGIVQPQTIDELISVVQFANQRRLKLTARGRGYSQSGQSIPKNGFSVDLTQMHSVDAVDMQSETVSCCSGAKWQNVVATTLQHNMLPKVIPLNLEQTVGGLLSVGGIGTNSRIYGSVAANVAELDVVTGSGEYIRCSNTQEPELYNAVLGGLGKCGIITKATIKLRKVKPNIRTFHLLYDSLDVWMNDQIKLGKSRQIEHLEGFCWTSAKGIKSQNGERHFFTHWLYGLQVGVEYEKTAPEASDVLKDLNYWKLVHVEDEETANHIFRYQPRFDTMRRTGAWNQTHPWIDCFISASSLTKILPEILDILPLSLGDGHRTMMVASENRPSLLMMPPGDIIFCFAILPIGVDSQDTHAVSALEKVNRMLLEAGGKRYLAGWLTNSHSWQQHYGACYQQWQDNKRKFDTHNVLSF
jgi:cytokinin dehydrogenase